MRKHAACAIGLVAFALVAALGALRGGDLADVLRRAILTGAVMAAVGYVAGFIAEKAVDEAVDRREPLRVQPTMSTGDKGSDSHREDGK
jgi:outer membrane lipoprotein SlyB